MHKRIYFDLETTTKYPSNATTLEFAYWIVDTQTNPFEPLDAGQIYCNIDTPIPASSTAIHGINNAKLLLLSDGKYFWEHASRIRKIFAPCQSIGGYNCKTFDIPILTRDLLNAGESPLPQLPVVDYCRKIRGFNLGLPNTQLETVYNWVIRQQDITSQQVEALFLDYAKRFDIRNLGTSAHGALFDTFMTIVVTQWFEAHGYPC